MGRLRNAAAQAEVAGYNANLLLAKLDDLMDGYEKQGFMEVEVSVPLDGPMARWFKKDKLTLSLKIKTPEAEVKVLPPG